MPASPNQPGTRIPTCRRAFRDRDIDRSPNYEFERAGRRSSGTLLGEWTPRTRVLLELRRPMTASPSSMRRVPPTLPLRSRRFARLLPVAYLTAGGSSTSGADRAGTSSGSAVMVSTQSALTARHGWFLVPACARPPSEVTCVGYRSAPRPCTDCGPVPRCYMFLDLRFRQRCASGDASFGATGTWR